MKDRAESGHVSPTAYATGYFWYRHGLSHPALLIPEGKKLDRRFRFLIGAIRLFTGFSIDALMLARHRGIDARLTTHLDSGAVTQVIELAAGLSARGWRFTQRYGKRVQYVETDLAPMARLKQDLLEQGGLLGPRHRVVAVDALLDGGPGSLEDCAAALDPSAGVAIVTEGLLSYLDPATARGLWRRIAKTLGRFPHGIYLSDCYVRTDRYGVGGALFRGVIQRFVRGRMHVHFQTVEEAAAILREAGFSSVALHSPADLPQTADLARRSGGKQVRILEATTK